MAVENSKNIALGVGWRAGMFKSNNMVNKYYESGAERASRVNALFQKIARHYDLVNDLQSLGMHRLWKREMVRQCKAAQGVTALDVCCGTGDITIRLSQAGAEVTGLDFSEAMLQIARQRKLRNSKKQTGGLGEFIQGDALNLPFENASFDVVTIAYGLRNLSDFEGGLKELWRVLRSGGRLAVLDLGKPEKRFWRTLFEFQLKWLIPWFGRLFYGDADTYAYLAESLKRYPAQSGLDKALNELGAQSVRQTDFIGGIMSLHVAVK